MSGGVVCYIERTPGGGGIRRLRLIAAGLARQWTAPEPSAVSSIDAGGGAGVNAARAGATWIAETLQGVGLKRLAAVCVDAEGSVCAWLSAPSADSTVVRDTIVQAGSEGDSSTGIGAARILSGADTAIGGGPGFLDSTSVQALATLDPEEPTRSSLSFRRKPPVTMIRKQRFAVISVQDAIVRVLLDELDARSIEVERVVSIWHAMASGWDGAQPASISDRLVSASSSGGAVILVEPSGRLIWAWTRAGELVAGGAMRLAAHSKQVRPADGTTAAPSRDAALAPLDTTSTSVFSQPEDDRPSVALEFANAEAGRLSLDWLSWSAQLGHCPQRVVCLSSPAVCDSSPDRPMGPEALFAHLAARWPGATVDGAVHDDPIGATIGRLAGLGPESPRLSTDDLPASAAIPFHARPREALIDLSRRPGRADRRLHQWIGVALIAAAALVAVFGYKIKSSIIAAEAQLQAARDARTAALKEAEKYSENVTKSLKPEGQLEGALARVRDQAKYLKTPRPVIEEAANVFAALADINANAPAPVAPATPMPATPGAPPALLGPGRTQLTEMEFSAVAATARLSVPDAATGPNVLGSLTTNRYVLSWQGSTQSGGGVAGGNRVYVLVATWPDNLTPAPRKSAAATPPAGTPSGAPPAPPPDAKPEPAKIDPAKIDPPKIDPATKPEESKIEAPKS